MKNKPVDPTKNLPETLRGMCGYLRSVNRSSHQFIKLEDGETAYWQLPEWIDGLLEIATDCELMAEIIQHRIEENQQQETSAHQQCRNLAEKIAKEQGLIIEQCNFEWDIAMAAGARLVSTELATKVHDGGKMVKI